MSAIHPVDHVLESIKAISCPLGLGAEGSEGERAGHATEEGSARSDRLGGDTCANSVGEHVIDPAAKDVLRRPARWKRPAFNGLVPTDHDTLDTATVLSYRSVGSVARIPKALRMALPKTIWLTASALALLALATSASAQDVEWADAMKAAERALTESR